MKSLKLGLLCTVLWLSACASTPRVSYDYDAKINLAKYHSFVVESVQTKLEDGGEAFKNPINEQRLKDAVIAEASKRGLSEVVEAAEPDVYFTISLGSRTALDNADNRTRVRVGFGIGSWHPGFGSSIYVTDDDFYRYREGRITIDLYEAKTRKALWHASVDQDLTYLSGDNAQRRITEVVAAMFAKFPAASSSPSNSP